MGRTAVGCSRESNGGGSFSTAAAAGVLVKYPAAYMTRRLRAAGEKLRQVKERRRHEVLSACRRREIAGGDCETCAAPATSSRDDDGRASTETQRLAIRARRAMRPVAASGCVSEIEGLRTRAFLAHESCELATLRAV